MTASGIRREVVSERAAWVRRMCAELAALPLDSLAAFQADVRNVAAAESFVRRALEALLDLGRHLLAKGLSQAAVEYKQIAAGLERHGVLDPARAAKLRDMAGYRNRLVHFYDEVGAEELFEIATIRAADIEDILATLLDWVVAHPERLDPPAAPTAT